MKNFFKIAMFMAVFSIFIGLAAGGQNMNILLKQPASVPLDFLDWVDQDVEWLRKSLAELGVNSGFKFRDGVLEANEVGALRAANRIRSFAFLAAPAGLRPPYFDLWVSEPGESLRCVTLFPQSIAPGIEARDFTRESFPASEANSSILDLCRVRQQKGADFHGLGRDAFRDKFFDAAGDLKIEFANRNSNAAFIAQAIDHGFFVLQQDFTGRLRLGAE